MMVGLMRFQFRKVIWRLGLVEGNRKVKAMDTTLWSDTPRS